MQRAQRIIFFRHGAVESRLSHICDNEIYTIRQACASLDEGYKPPITYLVVAIMHHSLPSPENQGRNKMIEVTNKGENVHPGTVVEEDGSNAIMFEFVSNHAAVEETSRLAQYRVILDENGFTADEHELQSLCHNLCKPRDRWAYPEMSMVPPAYFAQFGGIPGLQRC